MSMLLLLGIPPKLILFSPHHCGVLVFFVASRRVPRPRSASAFRVRRAHLISSHLIAQNSSQLISHNSSHTQLISHTTHLTHNSSHTQLISHNSSHTQLISHTTHLTHNSSHTQLISHTTHLTHNSSHTQLISHATHLTQLISTHLTQLISHNSSHAPHLTDVLLGRRNTQSLLTEVRRGLAPQWPRLLVAWQAQYAELVTGAAARIGAAVAAAAATCCVAGAVQRAELRRGLALQWPWLLVAWKAQYREPPEGAAARIGCVAGAVRRACYRSCGADWRRSGCGYLLRGRRSTESLLKELRRGLAPPWPRLLVV